MKAIYKTILLALSFYLPLSGNTQNLNLISPINISLPANLPANTTNWATAMPPVMIMAQGKQQNGQLPWQISEGTVLVTIKSNGNKICGAYTQQTAPSSGFSSATKIWNASAVLSFLGQECILKPGTYELCVQFYYRNPATNATGLAGEACKSFTIADTKQQSYAPPQNILPADDKKFTVQEVREPIQFRWTPIVPKPKAKVKYTIRIWDIPIRATKSQVIKTQAPIIVKEINELTQLSISASEFKQNKSENNTYAWYVEASKTSAMGDREMLGTSEATGFAMSSAGCGTNSDNVTVICKGWDNGKPTYTVGITFNNIIPTAGGQQCTTVMNTITSSTGTISGLATLPVTIPIGGTSPVVTFTYTPTVTGATIAAFAYQGIWNDGSSNTSNFSNTNVSLPSCVCDFCSKAVEFDHDLGTATITGNSLNIVQPLWDMAGNTIISTKAEIVYFERTVGDECMSCNKDAALWGNFTSGTLGTLAGTFAAATSPVSGSTHHTLYWNPPTGYTGALTPFKLYIKTPPLSTLTCCCEKIKAKIRYTYTFRDKATGECKTCDAGIFEYEAQKGTCTNTATSTGGGIK
ncbi:MAG: hypothetical protein IPN43_02840 [Chitinophagaceae bacterium]|nr:hypothetical protein [Chitinophagaceae bacterium]